MLSLANGHPSPDARDAEGLREAARLASEDVASWRYGPSDGDTELREQLGSLSSDHPDTIVVTSGSQQGIDLAVRSMLDPGDRVGVPEAVYPATLSVLAANGVRAVPLREDEAGVVPDALHEVIAGHRLRALYLTPTFGNPTGTLMPLERRRVLLDACAAGGVTVIEDDPYCDLWFDAAPPPSLWELTRDAADGPSVVSLRSASKTIAPGLRVGWMLAPASLRPSIVAMKQASDLQTSGLAQRTVASHLASGRLPDWMTRVRSLYRSRHDALIDGLTSAGFDAVPVAGGMFVWVPVPDGVDPQRLFDRAVANDVLYAPGASFSAMTTGGTTSRFMRLCFVTQADANITTATKRLGAALGEVRKS